MERDKLDEAFDRDGNLVRDQWVRAMAEPTPQRSALRSYVHVGGVPLQLATDTVITPLAVVDTCWYESDGGKLLTATSFLAPAPDHASAIRMLTAPQVARAYGRPIPDARWQLRLPARSTGLDDLPLPSAFAVSDAPDSAPSGTESELTASELTLHEWRGLDARTFVWLVTSDLAVLNGEAYEPAVVADVRVLDQAGRVAVAGRAIASGTNRRVVERLTHFAEQLCSLVPSDLSLGGRPLAARR